MLRVLIVGLLGLTLLGCASTQAPQEVSLTNTPSISYKLPSDQSIDIKFNEFRYCANASGTTCTQTNLLSFARENGQMVVTRTNGTMTGTKGVRFIVNEMTEKQGDISTVTYQPLKRIPVETGFVIMGTPDLNISEYLSSTQFSKKFEVDSEYPADSVKANFDRLMNKAKSDFRIFGNTESTLDLEDYYFIDLPSAKVVMLIEAFPYRKGSKVVVNAVIQTRQSNKGIIDVAEIIREVEKKVISVVSS